VMDPATALWIDTYRTFFPRFKAGVRMLLNINRARDFYIGTPIRGLLYSDSPIALLFKEVNGQLPITYFLEHAQNGEEELVRMMRELVMAGLIKLQESAEISFVTDLNQSQRNFRERLQPEHSLSDWRLIPMDKARALEKVRRDFSILIFGTKRLAIGLLSILQASGFTNTKIIAGDRALMRDIDKSFAQEIVKPIDLCGMALRISDIGVRKSQAIEMVSRNSRLENSESDTFPKRPSLIISTEMAQPDYLQRWMSEGTAHLQISPLYESQIEIGPLVLPGKSPCLRCVSLKRIGNDDLSHRIEMSAILDSAPEIPASATAYITGLIALYICELADTGSTELIGKSIRINLFEPCNPEHIYHEPHSLCGCFEVI
jgi:hypothetical protein